MDFLTAVRRQVLLVLLVLLSLSACRETVGPSSERIERDVQEAIYSELRDSRELGVPWADLVKYDGMIINERKALSDDRVKVFITAFFVANEEGIRFYVHEKGMPKDIVESGKSFEEGIKQLVELHNDSPDLEGTLVYHLKYPHVWRVEDEYRGHR